MSWSGRQGKFRNAKEFFMSEFGAEVSSGKIADFSVGKREKSEWGDDFEVYETPIFCAVKDGGGNISAAVILVDERKEKGGTTWMRKIIGEDAGPCEDRCPMKILDLLDDTGNETALAWRERCYRNLGKDMPQRPTQAPSM